MLFRSAVIARDFPQPQAALLSGILLGVDSGLPKSGDPQKAFEHYSVALQIDPKHKGAHEYIGEAYLETNNLAKAEEHLKKLDDICNFGCQEFRDLRAAVQAYKKKNNIAS